MANHRLKYSSLEEFLNAFKSGAHPHVKITIGGSFVSAMDYPPNELPVLLWSSDPIDALFDALDSLGLKAGEF